MGKRTHMGVLAGGPTNARNKIDTRQGYVHTLSVSSDR